MTDTPDKKRKTLEPGNPPVTQKKNKRTKPTNAIKRYLEWDVNPIPLPELDAVAESGETTIKTYPPLILDGASGVGKTQQAFALLKSGQQVVYLVLAPVGNDSQLIYQAMDRLCSMSLLRKKVKLAKAQAIQWSKGKTSNVGDTEKNDYLSIERLRGSFVEKLEAFLEGNLKEGKGDLFEFIEMLWSQVLKYNKETHNIEFAHTEEAEKNLGEKVIDLANTVFFIDEALPSPASSTQTANPPENTYKTAKENLKFLRNFARVLNMRSVLAGTAATAANMWTTTNDESEYSHSRGSKTTLTWAEVHFLYRCIKDETNRNIKHRPLLKTWLSDIQSNNLCERINRLKSKMLHVKTFTNENKFIWLSGACLSTNENTPSPFQLKPSELVRGHFFEPAVASCEYKIGDQRHIEIHDGRGFGKVSRKIRDMRLKIEKYVNGDKLYWVLREVRQEVRQMDGDTAGDELQLQEGLQDDGDTAGDESPLKPMFGLHYSVIEYALTNCVQVCLATEPLFALFVSGLQELSDEDFKVAIRKAMPETTIQRTRGALDGELHEQIIFAALQLSCNKAMDESSTVENCVRELSSYLRADISERREYDTAANFLNGKMIDVAPTPKSQQTISFDYHKESDPSKKNCAKTMFESEKMPWLVPACDKDSLEERIKKCGNDYFAELNIAGLVPGVTNAKMDAEAFIWKNQLKNPQNELKPDWSFEFRARTQSYSSNAAMNDLKKKMTDINPETEQTVARAHHGMLIAIINGGKSKCKYCIVQVGDKNYLRVVVLIGLSKRHFV